MHDPIRVRRATPVVSTDLIPLVSIVIPAFNVAPYLQACLASVLREVDVARALGKAEFEIIVVDDCSGDATGTLARELLSERAEARIETHEKNRGLAAARNTGIDASRGDFILFLDSDNTLLEGALPRITDATSRYAEADVIILGMDLIDVRGERTGVFYGERVPANPLDRLRSHPLLLLDGNLMDNFCIIRAGAARMARYDESLRRLEDWDFWVRLHYEHHCNFAILEESVGGYRIRPGQLTEEHTLQNESFVRTMLQIYAKSLAMAVRLDLPTPAVQRLQVNVQNVGSAYSQLAAPPASTSKVPQDRAGEPTPASPTGLSTVQLNLGAKTVPFAFRGESVGDKGVISQIFQNNDYNLTLWVQGRRFLNYYAASVNAKPGLIIDAGANIGASAVYFLELFHNSFICAIEPEINNFRILEFNTRAYQNKTNLHAAIAATDGEAYLEDPGMSDWGFRTSTKGPPGAPGVKIPAVSVPSILKSATAAVPMIFKCDIEGGEDSVFSGDSAWMREFPVIIVELHDWMLPFSGTSRNFLRAVAQHDFDFIYRGENIFLFNRQLLS